MVEPAVVMLCRCLQRTHLGPSYLGVVAHGNLVHGGVHPRQRGRQLATVALSTQARAGMNSAQILSVQAGPPQPDTTTQAAPRAATSVPCLGIVDQECASHGLHVGSVQCEAHECVNGGVAILRDANNTGRVGIQCTGLWVACSLCSDEPCNGPMHTPTHTHAHTYANTHAHSPPAGACAELLPLLATIALN